MSYEQLTWIDPFIYREWPVRLAHRICVKSKDLKSFPASTLLRIYFSLNLSCFPASTLLRFLCSFRRGLVGPRRRVPVMKHSHIVRVTRLSHPKEFEFDLVFSSSQ
jgi:hypothetical protein